MPKKHTVQIPRQNDRENDYQTDRMEVCLLLLAKINCSEAKITLPLFRLRLRYAFRPPNFLSLTAYSTFQNFASDFVAPFFSNAPHLKPRFTPDLFLIRRYFVTSSRCKAPHHKHRFTPNQVSPHHKALSYCSLAATMSATTSGSRYAGRN